MPPCRIKAKSSKKPLSHRVPSPAGRAFVRMYKAVLAGLAYPVEPPSPEYADETRPQHVSRYRAYASPSPTAIHPAFRDWGSQHSEHPQPLRSHSPKSSMSSRTDSEISEIDKETKPDASEHWDADDFPVSPYGMPSGRKRHDSCHSDLTVEEQVQFAQAVPIKRAIRKSFYPPPRTKSKLDMRVSVDA